MPKPSQKIVLITGAAGGIGTALCDEFKKAGYFVIGTDLDEGCIKADAFIRCDLAEFSKSADARVQFLSALPDAVKQHGLTCLINNAAVQKLGGVTTLGESEWQETLDVNLLAPFFLTQALLPSLERAKGSVINIASIHSIQTKAGFVAYATSKAALEGMTRSLAIDLGGKIRVNAVSPAATRTPMLEAGFEGQPKAMKALEHCHPLGRIAEPREVASLALFLASDQASFITGSVMRVDGGISGRLHDPA